MKVHRSLSWTPTDLEQQAGVEMCGKGNWQPFENSEKKSVSAGNSHHQ